MKKIIVVVVMFMLSGCATYDFTGSKLGGAKNQIVAAAMMGWLGQEVTEPRFAGASAKAILNKTGEITKIEQTLKSFKESCESPPPEPLVVSTALIPLIAAIPKLIFDVSVDRTNKKMEALKKSAVSSYSVDFILPTGGISDYQCLVIIRHDKDLNVNATIGYRINIYEGLVMLSPKFLWAKNTTAKTKQVEADEKVEITFMSGVSLQGIGKQENGIPIIASSGQDSKKIGKFNLGEENAIEIQGNLSIGPVPLINTPSASIFRVSVTEKGDVGFDIDEKIAENEAVKEAIGSAMAEGVKARLEELYKK